MGNTSTRILGRLQREKTKYQKAITELVWSVTPAGRRSQSELAGLNGMFAGRRCFVMGNGPSLLKCDLGLLKDEVTIGSNAQYLSWDTMGFIPTFLTVEDRLVAEDRAAELCALARPTKIFPRDLLYCLRESRNTIFINFVRDYQPFPRFTSDFQKIVYWGGTVSVLNLQLAYYLGCSEIYLIGFDHNYQVPKDVKDFVITSQGDDVNHIHPDYFGKGYRWHDPNLARMEQSYIEARRFLDTQGIPVRNATVGGHLEVFERIDYDTLFSSNATQGDGRE
ncbi:6-hydroxymethylpterin diphosphokinase MptE-like protein [Mycobacterium sp. SA01]|uniref:6-hydroxymethylpterin diphosphokinase MptE-like protein n=1 Tax=Mycobacterium sp. SA01 TaxID=3238820 RepID=UPI00351B9C8F